MAKDSTTQLQTAYYQLLNNNVTLSGNPVPVYDDVPANGTYPHIQFNITTLTDQSTKTSFMDDGTFKRTKISHGSKEIPKFLWQNIIKKQLQVSMEYFNKVK